MDDEIQCSVQFSFNQRTCPTRLVAQLTVYTKKNCFALQPPGKSAIHFGPDDFSEFTQPMHISATVFDIPFLKGDERMCLNLKFSNSWDLQTIYAALHPMFDKAGKLAVPKMKKRKNGRDDLNQYFANSPGGSPTRSRNPAPTQSSQADCDEASEAYSSLSVVVDNLVNAATVSQPIISWLDGTTSGQNNLEEFHVVPNSPSSPDLPSETRYVIYDEYSNGISVQSTGFPDIYSAAVRSPESPGLIRNNNMVHSQGIESDDSAIDIRGEEINDVFEEKAFLAAGDSLTTANRYVFPSRRSNPVKKSPFQFRSFANLGNSCYMNSVLQTLLHSSGVRTSFSRLKSHREFRGNCSKIVTNLFELIQKMDIVKYESVSQDVRQYLRYVLEKIRKSSGMDLNAVFGGTNQQDAHEYWVALLAHVGNQVNDYEEVINGSDRSDQSLELSSKSSEDSTLDHSLIHSSSTVKKLIPPGDRFKILISNRLGCNKCGAVKKAKIEEHCEMQLIVSHNPEHEESVDSLINKSLKPIQLDCRCDECGGNDANQTLGFHYFPSYIMVLLKRYHYDNIVRNKISTSIHVNRDLFLARYHVDSKDRQEERKKFIEEKTVQMERAASSMSYSSDQIHEAVPSYSDIWQARAPESQDDIYNLSPIKHNSSLENTEPMESDDVGLACMEVDSPPNIDNLDYMEISPLKDGMLGGDPTASPNNNAEDKMYSGRMHPNNESSIVFKPLCHQLLSRIRSELNVDVIRNTSKSDSWYESMASADGNVFQIVVPEVADVKSDASSLFRSLSWWILNGDDYRYDMIRDEVIRFMRQFPKEFHYLLPGYVSMNEYSRIMRSYDERGTNVELYVAATMLRCPVYVYSNNSWQCFSPLFAVWFDEDYRQFSKYDNEPPQHNVDNDGAIYLSMDCDQHYKPVVGRKTQIEEHSLDHPEPPYVYNEEDGPVYTLTGVINHQGPTMYSGHYTAITYDEAVGVWVHCNDSDIYVSSEKDVLLEAGRNGYMLIYKKRIEGDEMEFTHSPDYLK